MHFRAQIDRDKKTGKIHYQVSHFMDANPVLRSTELSRAREEVQLNKRNELRPQARLPFTEVLNIRQRYGIDAMNIRPDQEKAFWKIMQREYPKFLTTNKRVYRPPSRKIRFAPGTLELAR